MVTNGHTDTSAYSVDFTPLGAVNRPDGSALEAILWFDIGAQVPGRAYACDSSLTLGMHRQLLVQVRRAGQRVFYHCELTCLCAPAHHAGLRPS